ncbi:unnamed protein product [Gordionus sp. m RMFG-2023]|uniref:ATP-binding cassette sub-family C member 10-like n=1 Tax=Gordionus sp. m RMFG-2023 TaxID=3053472 RepID=UPI0030E3EC1D
MINNWQHFCCNNSLPSYSPSPFNNDTDRSNTTSSEYILYFIFDIFKNYICDFNRYNYLNVCFERLLFLILPFATATICHAYTLGTISATRKTKCYSIKDHATIRWLNTERHAIWWTGFSLIPCLGLTLCGLYQILTYSLLQATHTPTYNNFNNEMKPGSNIPRWLNVNTLSSLILTLFWIVRIKVSRHNTLFRVPTTIAHEADFDCDHLANTRPPFVKLKLKTLPKRLYLFFLVTMLPCPEKFREHKIKKTRITSVSLRGLRIALNTLRILILSSLALFLTSIPCLISTIYIILIKIKNHEINLVPSYIEIVFFIGSMTILFLHSTIVFKLTFEHFERLLDRYLIFHYVASRDNVSIHLSNGLRAIEPTETASLLRDSMLRYAHKSYGSLKSGYSPTSIEDIADYKELPNNAWHYDSFGLFSRSVFAWIGPLITSIRVWGLKADSLILLPSSLCYAYLNSKYIKPHRSSASLNVLAIIKSAAGIEFLALGLLKFANEVVYFSCPLLLNALLKALQNRRKAANSESVSSHDYTLSILGSGMGLASATMLSTIITVHFDFRIRLIGLRVKSILTHLIYERVLRTPLAQINSPLVLKHESCVRKSKKNSEISTESTKYHNQAISPKNKEIRHEEASIEGTVMNIISSDIDRVVNFFGSFHSFWSLPLQIIISLYLLYTQVGMTFLAGIALVIIMIPVNKWLATRIASYSTNMMRVKDARLKHLSQLISHWKAVKMMHLENYFEERVTKARTEELKYVAKQKYLDALCVYFWATTPVLMSVSTFVSYILYRAYIVYHTDVIPPGNSENVIITLDASKIFTSLALFNMLISPLNSFPWVINGLIEAWISLGRIQSLTDHLKPSLHPSETDAFANNQVADDECTVTYRGTSILDHKMFKNDFDTVNKPFAGGLLKRVIRLEKSTFSWQHDCLEPNSESQTIVISADENNISPNSNFLLSDIDLIIDLSHAGLIGVTGATGSGKTSLLMALMNEMHLINGRYFMESVAKSEFNSNTLNQQNVNWANLPLAYSAQVPWIKPGTIRSNILFGSPFLLERYNEVIKSLKLDEDFDTMPLGDLTKVCPDGAETTGNSLSGGQRTRISLARAMYQDADLYLLDEPMAALDNHVASHVFYKAILGFLVGRCGKVVIFVCGRATEAILNRCVIIWNLDGNGHLNIQNGQVYNNDKISRKDNGHQDLMTKENMPEKCLNDIGNFVEDTLSGDESTEFESSNGRTIHASTLTYYIRSVGYFLFCAILLSFLAMQLTRNGCDWWLTYSSFDETRPSHSPNDNDNNHTKPPNTTFYYALPLSLTPLFKVLNHPSALDIFGPVSSIEYISHSFHRFIPLMISSNFPKLSSPSHITHHTSIGHAFRLINDSHIFPPIVKTYDQLTKSSRKIKNTLHNLLNTINPFNLTNYNTGRNLINAEHTLKVDEIHNTLNAYLSTTKYHNINLNSPNIQKPDTPQAWVHIDTLNYSLRLFLFVYVLLGLTNSLFTAARSFIFAFGGLVAARRCHAELFSSCLRADLSANKNDDKIKKKNKSNTNKTSPSIEWCLLNRFSADTYTVDNSLPFASNILLAQAFGLAGALCVGFWAQPMLVPLTLPLTTLLYLDLQSFYRGASREIRRLEASALSPVLARAGEAIEGKVHVRNMWCGVDKETIFEMGLTGNRYENGDDGARIIKSSVFQHIAPALNRFTKGFARTVDAYLTVSFNSNALSQWLNIRLQLFGTIFISALVVMITLQNKYLPATIDDATIGLALSYFLALTARLGGLVTILVDTEKDFISVERIKEFGDSLTPEDDSYDSVKEMRSEKTEEVESNDRAGDIIFRNVSVDYNSNDDNSRDYFLALNNVSFTINSRERIGVVGRTGAGKSTLFATLLKMTKLSRIENDIVPFISVSGYDLINVRSSLLRGHLISVVPQSPFILPASIRTNLDPQRLFTDSQIIERLHASDLNRSILEGGITLDTLVSTTSSPDSEMPNSINNICSNYTKNRIELSHGQKQILSLARAVISERKVILIDEPTSNLDKPSQDFIMDCIFNSPALQNSTILIIAHRLETLTRCDKIMVLERGKLVEMDTPDVLFNNPESKLSSFANTF